MPTPSRAAPAAGPVLVLLDTLLALAAWPLALWLALSVLTEVVRARRASPAPVRRSQVSRIATAPPQSTLLQGATPSPTRTNGSCCGG